MAVDKYVALDVIISRYNMCDKTTKHCIFRAIKCTRL